MTSLPAEPAEPADPVAARTGRQARWRDLLRQLAGSPTGLLGVVIVVAILVAALGAGGLAPFPPDQAAFLDKLKPPLTAGHLFGTDQLGRDVFSRILYGARVSLMVGVASAVLAGIVGVATGAIAGYAGGFLDALLMRIVDTFLSFPFVLLVLVVNAIIGGGVVNIILSLVTGGWVLYARVIRGEVLALREKDFILASEAVGLPHWRILATQILPNLVTPIVVLFSLQVATFIVAEASVSFLGFGVQPPTPAWGNMLSEGKDYIFSAWWLITFPGLAIVVTVLGINLFGDWLRDVLDPESETRR
jgi:peptide/nickel transport system permease protein